MLLKNGKTLDKLAQRIADTNNLKSFAYKLFVEDRRYKFNDLSKVKSQNRKVQSPILNFYCGTNNIGDLIPSLGIRKMIDQNIDAWSILRNFRNQEIDFDFVNKNYQCIVIGGAGLFAKNLEPFWHQFVRECKLPSIIWGVGGAGFGDSGYQANKQYVDAVSQAAQKCDLVNIRDRYSAELFNIQNPSFSACPSIVYLQEYKSLVTQDSNLLLYSSHELSMSQEEKIKIRHILNQVEPNFIFTDHTQYSFLGLEDILKNYYAKSDFVVTTRLHGAIIAYGLGIPYLAINRAKKIEAFFKEYGNGLMIDAFNELESLLESRGKLNIDIKPISIQPILDFGNKAKDWMSSIID